MKRSDLFGIYYFFHKAFILSIVLFLSLFISMARGQDTGGEDLIEAETVTDTLQIPPKDVKLTGYPNPCKEYAYLSYSMPYNAQVVLEINNHLGRRIMILVDDYQEAGEHKICINTAILQPGIYIATLRLQSLYEEDVVTTKLVRGFHR